ncbi:Uncharacterised protein [Mycobacterium tuberculosis]|nr:Uncharacterised protein [Mycobacterium tuberculosis]
MLNGQPSSHVLRQQAGMAVKAIGWKVRNHGVKTGRALRVSSFGKGTRRTV